MKEILRRIGWRLKWNWRVCAGHFIDSDGVYTTVAPFDLYRFIYQHTKTGEVRYEDRALNPWYSRFGLPVLEAVAILALFSALRWAWLVLP